MFLKIFRSQQPANFFVIPLIALVLWLPAFFHAPPGLDSGQGMPLYRWLSVWIHGFPGVVVAWALVVGQAFYLNYLITKYEVLYKPSFLPALLYVLLMSFSRQVMWLHPVIVVNLLLLLPFDKAFSLFKHPSPIRLLFESSFFAGLAFLFYFPAAVFYLLLLLSLGIIRSLSLREWTVTLIGFLLPFYFACVWFFWKGTLSVFIDSLHPPVPGFRFLPGLIWTKALIALASIVSLLGLLSLLRLRRNFYKNTIRTRSNQRVFVYALFAAAVSITLVPAISLFHFTLFALPLAVFIGYYFLSFKSKPWISDLLFAALVAAVVWNQF